MRQFVSRLNNLATTELNYNIRETIIDARAAEHALIDLIISQASEHALIDLIISLLSPSGSSRRRTTDPTTRSERDRPGGYRVQEAAQVGITG
jgi:hypothetical protein